MFKLLLCNTIRRHYIELILQHDNKPNYTARLLESNLQQLELQVWYQLSTLCLHVIFILIFLFPHSHDTYWDSLLIGSDCQKLTGKKFLSSLTAVYKTGSVGPVQVSLSQTFASDTMPNGENYKSSENHMLCILWKPPQKRKTAT